MTCPRCKDKTDRVHEAPLGGILACLALATPLICTLCLLELEHWCKQPPPGWLLIGPHKWPVPMEPEPKGVI